MLSAQHLRLGLRAKTQGVERTEDHMTGDLHLHGQNSPDIPMSSIQNFFTLQFHFRRDIGMAGSETMLIWQLRISLIVSFVFLLFPYMGRAEARE